jgi:hypothetical protein
MHNDYQDIELEYALRMVHAGFATPAEAARICGIALHTLNGELSGNADAEASGGSGASQLVGSAR